MALDPSATPGLYLWRTSNAGLYATTNLFLWLKSDVGLYTDAAKSTPATADGDLVYRWEDQSGAGNDVVQVTAANRPLFDSTRKLVQSRVGLNQYFTTPPVPVNSRTLSAMFICKVQGGRGPYPRPVNNALFMTSANTSSLYYPSVPGGKLVANNNQVVKQMNCWVPSSLSCIIVSFGPTNATVYINGVQIDNPPLADGTSNLASILGYTASNNWTLQGGFQEISFWSTAIDSTDAATLFQHAQSAGVPASYSKVFVLDADSITYGIGAALNQGWPNQADFGPGSQMYNMGLAGVRLSTLVANAATQIDPMIQVGRTNVLIVFAGSNDIYGSLTPATTVYANLQSYCTARRSAGWTKIIVVTTLPRGGVAPEAQRLKYNTSIRNGFSAGTLACDAVADVASDANIGQTGQQADTSYYADGIHPTSAGHAVVANYVTAAIKSLGLP